MAIMPPSKFLRPKKSAPLCIQKRLYICIHLETTVKCTMGKYLYRLNKGC